MATMMTETRRQVSHSLAIPVLLSSLDRPTQTKQDWFPVSSAAEPLITLTQLGARGLAALATATSDFHSTLSSLLGLQPRQPGC